MPCLCCGAPQPAKGFNPNKSDPQINEHLKNAAKLIMQKYVNPYDYPEEAMNMWFPVWIKAFEHHLKGCPEKEKI